jgi:hypothetical protein
MGVLNWSMPLSPQLELLSAHANEVERFGAAEKYFYELSKVPGYALRVESMLQVSIFTLRVLLAVAVSISSMEARAPRDAENCLGL